MNCYCAVLCCTVVSPVPKDQPWHCFSFIMCRVACRDADIVSLGLTAFAALMGDAGAAAGEPLESYRATTESTGVPELSPLGRQAFDLSYSPVVQMLRSSAVQAREGQSVRVSLILLLFTQ